MSVATWLGLGLESGLLGLGLGLGLLGLGLLWLGLLWLGLGLGLGLELVVGVRVRAARLCGNYTHPVLHTPELLLFHLSLPRRLRPFGRTEDARMSLVGLGLGLGLGLARARGLRRRERATKETSEETTPHR